MGEEVLSPTTPNPEHGSPQPQSTEKKRPAGQGNNGPRSRRFSAQKPTKGEWGRNKEKGHNKSRWPGLNVVTNFSKPPALAKRAADADVGYLATESVPFSDVKGVHEHMQTTKEDKNRSAGHDRQEPIKGATTIVINHNRKDNVADKAEGLGLQQHEKPIATSPRFLTETKGTVNDLKRASSKWSNISPSDRAIMIGISIPSTKFADHVISPDGEPVQHQGLTARHYSTENGPPATPTIVVTPAKDEAPWSASPKEQTMGYRRRPASSVYSQAVQSSRGVTQMSDIPPVPAYPSTYQARRIDPPVNRRNSPPRVVSTCTVFDEDESPPVASRGRSYSGESQLRILTRASQDTLATRHRSQGWWNYILSPFQTRPNTMMLKSPSGSVPDLPSPSPRAELARDQGKNTSPGSPQGETEIEGCKTDHTCYWTDASPFETDEKSALVADRGLDVHPRAIGIDSHSPHKQFEGFGEAAEYYQACWHDQNSPTPYFECQNHSCLPIQTGDLEDVRNGFSREIAIADPGSTPNVNKAEELSQQKAKVFQQEPSNRFSAAFKEAVTPKTNSARPISGSTEIEELDTTPEVEEAHVAPVVRGGAIIPATRSPEPKAEPETAKEIVESLQPAKSPAVETPISSPPKVVKPLKRIVAVMPPQHHPATEQPLSPEASSPFVHSAARGENAIPLVEVSREINNPPPAQTTYIVNHYHGDAAVWRHREQTSLADFEPQPRFDPPPRAAREDIKIRNINEKHDLPPRYTKEKKSSKCRTCFRFKKRTKKQKWIRAGIIAALSALILGIVLLCVFLTRRGDQMPVQSQWLNITGYPPIPTGISTIVQPDAVLENSGCVQPTTMWDCSLPKEQQPSVVPNAPNQPNFRIEIRFRNGTSPNGTALNATGNHKRSAHGSLNPVSAGTFIRSQLLRVRDTITDSLFIALPSPPSQEDQVFLGNTTDNNTAPFDGEFTPFFMTFDDPSKFSSQLSRRNFPDPQNLTDPFPDLTKTIPPPAINLDGTAASATLLPLPSAQPLRLYNRGLATEHYGFYTYFDRSIFLKSTALVNASSNNFEIPDDKNGGANENAATVRCTWAQTRFLVQIWTNKGTTAPLLASLNATNTTSTPTSTSTDQITQSQNLTTSSANNFRRPGSFPYPVSISLDRHGGDITTKEIYCYGLDQREHIVLDQKKLQLENRAFGGVLVNPALGPFGHVNVSRADGGPGGIDGGNGGCGCRWQNFQGS